MSFENTHIFLNNKKYNILMLIYNIKTFSISVISVIFTLFIFLHWVFSRIVIRCFRMLPSYLIKQLERNLNSYRQENINISFCIQTIINSCLSMISAIMVVDYCHKFIQLVQIISHQTHRQFLSLVLPQIPEFWSYESPYLIDIYLILGYLGLSAQISFTLDLLYLFNIPTIFIYKLLAFAYQIIIKSICVIYEILTRDVERWITCQKNTKWIIQNIKPIKVMCLGIMVFLLHALLFVSFYYLWLTIVIVSLTIFMKIMKIMLGLVRQMGNVICIGKGYHRDMEKGKWKLFIKSLQTAFEEARINVKVVRDIFIGKDIIQLPNTRIQNNYTFSIQEVYFCFTKVKI